MTPADFVASPTLDVFGGTSTPWPRVRLGDVCLINPRLPKAEQLSATTEISFVPMASVNEMRGEIEACERRPFGQVAKGYTGFRNGDVLFAKITPCMENGKAAVARELVNGHGVGSTEFFVIRPGERILPDFIFYYIRQPEFRRLCKANFTDTAGQQRVPRQFLENVEISLPPLDEQRRIVEVLERAAGIRRRREQALDKARALIPALFLDMFGDPATNPKGWPVRPLGTLIGSGPQNGLYRPQQDYGSGTPILRIDSFDDGACVDCTQLLRVQIDSSTQRKYALHSGDIVINRVNSPTHLGKHAIVGDIRSSAVFESNMMRFRVDESHVSVEWFSGYLQTTFARRALSRNAKHAINQSSINQTDVRSLPVMLPSLKAQSAFAERVADIRAIIARQERSLDAARALERSLMAHLLG
jgi:type I restriction enzyme S subunit